jgi:hypothetical protein
VVFALAVFFLFPLVQGGILGQVRDRLDSPEQPPGRFGAYGRAHYVRLMGSQALFALVMFGIMIPTMCLGMSVAVQEMAKTIQNTWAEGAPSPAPPDTQELTRQLFSNPFLLAGMGLSSVLMAAVAMVYWVANCIVVSEQQPVLASWGRALRFCHQHFPVVLVVGSLSYIVGLSIAPLSLAGQLGIVKEPWALGGLALAYSALIGYWGVLLAGLSMSLYLARRQPSGQREPELAVVH